MRSCSSMDSFCRMKEVRGLPSEVAQTLVCVRRKSSIGFQHRLKSMLLLKAELRALSRHLLLRFGAAAIFLGDYRVKTRLLLRSQQCSNLFAGSSTDHVVTRAHISTNRLVVIARPVQY